MESGPLGYRVGPAASMVGRAPVERGTPRDRLHRLVRRMLDDPEGVDVYDIADELHVSSATVDADLTRVRALLGGMDLALERSASRARLRGDELARRRLLSRLAHDEMDAAAFDLAVVQRSVGASLPPESSARLKGHLVAGLGDLGYFVNEFGIIDVVTHIVIAADRNARGHPLQLSEEGPREAEDIAALIGRLVSADLGVDLGAGDRRHLAMIVLTRVVAPGSEARVATVRSQLKPGVLEAVREVVELAASEYLVDIAHDDFVLRLALHVQNLMLRARAGALSRNPLTRELKASHPMVFEVAVFVASGLQERLGIPIVDDEIGYIAMHIGGRIERNRQSERLLTATIVCPGYQELHELLRSSVDRSLGQAIEVVWVETRVDPNWAAIDTDLVLTAIEPPVVSDRFVRIQPFLTDADVSRVQTAAVRIRRSRRLASLRSDLERYLSADAFVRGLDGVGGEDAVIRRLGALLVAQGVIDDDYVERTIERERLSSTAFTDALAVPHALAMTATRTSIAVGIADPSIPWGDGRVNVVALVAFSETDREAFQTVFEQFVEVFSERDSVQRIIRRAVDFPSFLEELVAVIDG